MTNEQKQIGARIAVTAAVTIIASAVPVSVYGGSRLLHMLPFLLAYILISYDVFHDAWRNILRGQVFDEKFLLSLIHI